MNPNVPNEPISSGPDLSRPDVLAAELREASQGMAVQAQACGHRATALAGNPYPEQFYARVADLLSKAADAISPATPTQVKAAEATRHTMAGVAAESVWNGGEQAPDKKRK